MRPPWTGGTEMGFDSKGLDDYIDVAQRIAEFRVKHPAGSLQPLNTEHPVQAWAVKQARNLLMDLEDAGTRVKFVLHDRDASFTATFDAVLRAGGARVIRSAVQAPRMNSVMERWIGSCRRELLDRTLVWNQRH